MSIDSTYLREEGAPADAAFDAFAPFYDAFTVHHDYEAWLGVLLPLAEAAGLSGNRVLDVGCGTAKSLGPFVTRGWKAAGTDISAGMLGEARRKLGDDVPLFEHDMRDLPALGEFDLVCSLCDAVNWVVDEIGLVQTFAGFRRNLAPGGIVMFDVNTLATFRIIATSALVQQDEDRILVMEGRGGDELPPGSLVRFDFVVYQRRQDWLWSSMRAPQIQRHHPENEVRRALSAAGLECVGVRGQDLNGRMEESLDDLRDSKAVYLARVSAP